jgi:hypothetical protein
LIVAPAARVIVSNDGMRIEATVDEATLDERGFTNTTLVIALALALRHRGLFHMHAGGLVRGDGTRVVVMGDSGSGKTTTTLGLLDSRAQHLGDDTLFLAELEGRACLLAFPRPFHLGPATARAFSGLRGASADGDAKVQVGRGDLPGVPIEQMAAPHVVLFPQVTREATSRVAELSKSDAFGLALRSSAFVAVDGLGRKKEQLALLASLLEGARAFELHLGRDWLDAPARAAECVPWGECLEAT